MKKINLIMIFILCLPLALAVYGGETWTYHFDKCDNLEVNITGTDEMTEGEYAILNDCTKNQTNYYICDCNDNYDFNVTFKINAVNNYTFNFNYAYSKHIEDDNGGIVSSSHSGSSGAFAIRFLENVSRILMLKPNIISRFWIDGIQHTIKLVEIGEDYIIIEIQSEIKRLSLNINETKQISLDNGTLELTLKNIRGRVAFIEFEKLQKSHSINDEKSTVINETTTEEPMEINETIEEAQGEVIIEFPKEERKINVGLIIAAAIIVIGLIVWFIITKKRAK